MANRQTREDARSRLGERTAQIVQLRDDGLLLWEIAEHVGVTKERVRQILAKARSLGAGPRPPSQVVTRQASILLGLSAEMRPGSFWRLMAKFGVGPVASKRGRLYWSVANLRGIKAPKCQVCGSPIPLSRYSRSVTCSRACSMARRYNQSARRKAGTAKGAGKPGSATTGS